MLTLCSVITTLLFFIMPSPTTLYDNTLNEIVTLPAGYFVVQTEQTDDTPQGYIQVEYDDLKGLVKTTDVQAVDYVPVTKYEKTATFKCDNDGQPVNLRSAPYRTAQILTTLNSNDTGRLYGTIQGDALFKNGDTLWYYVNANGVRGYCYYAHVSVDDVPPNIIEKEEPDEQPVISDQTTTDEDLYLPKAASIALIVVLCIPIPFIIFFLFRKKSD